MEPIKRDTHDIYDYISATGHLAGAAKGKTVIVTGGGKGIGKAVTRQFALAGATHVLITGRSLSALHSAKAELEAESPGCTIVPVAGDITAADTAARIFAALPNNCLADVLVNNAGANHSTAHIADSDPDLWWRDFELNVKAVYLMTRAYIQSLGGQPGTIINVTTSVADIAVENMSAYGGSKIAVNRLTEVTQVEYGAQGVRCVCVHPGGIESTGMGQNCPPQFRGRLCDTVELAAGTMLYLSTPEASFLDGRMVYADWNMEKVAEVKDEIVKENLLISRVKYGSVLSMERGNLPEGVLS